MELLRSLLEQKVFDPTKKLLDTAKKVGAKVVPDRKKSKEPRLTIRKGDIGMEFTWLPDDPEIVGWLELEWTPRSKNPRTGSSGNDDLSDVLRIAKRFFK
jgi:hypothetical protein